MYPYQQDFLKFAIANNVLRFGNFTLKSGRQSPYFFNLGSFHTGDALAKLGHFYAEAIRKSKIEFDVLFGPAYKGIPLVTATAIALSDQLHRHIPYCFNRKEIKDHGEGGATVGAPLTGRILVIDDVITAGTAIRETAQIIQEAGAQLVGIVIALDRQERGQTALSAIEEVEKSYAIPVTSIVNFDDLISYLTLQPDHEETLALIKDYRNKYGLHY